MPQVNRYNTIKYYKYYIFIIKNIITLNVIIRKISNKQLTINDLKIYKTINEVDFVKKGNFNLYYFFLLVKNLTIS